jgi:hypothetical protein
MSVYQPTFAINSTKEYKKMFKNKKFSLIVIGMLVLAVALGLVAFAPVETASAGSIESDGFNHGRGPGGFRPGGPGGGEALAESLGISIEELQAAQQAAQEAAIEQALSEGLITQAQADRLRESDFKRFQMLAGPDNPVDMDAHLAEALEISVDELSEARETAKNAAIQQALEDGAITADQAAMMEARAALKNYIEKDALLAKALGISAEELEAAKEDGQRLPDLLEELDIDPETFEANMQAAHEGILQQAVEDGLITQEQADLLLENGFGGMPGPRGRGGCPGGRGDFGRPGGFQGRPGGEADGTNFQPPGPYNNQG